MTLYLLLIVFVIFSQIYYLWKLQLDHLYRLNWTICKSKKNLWEKLHKLKQTPCWKFEELSEVTNTCSHVSVTCLATAQSQIFFFYPVLTVLYSKSKTSVQWHYYNELEFTA